MKSKNLLFFNKHLAFALIVSIVPVTFWACLKSRTIYFDMLVNDPLIQSDTSDEKIKALTGQNSSDPTLLSLLSSSKIQKLFLESLPKNSCVRSHSRLIEDMCKSSLNNIPSELIKTEYLKSERFQDLQIIRFSFSSNNASIFNDKPYVKLFVDFLIRYNESYRKVKIDELSTTFDANNVELRSKLQESISKLSKITEQLGGPADEVVLMLQQALVQNEKDIISNSLTLDSSIRQLSSRLRAGTSDPRIYSVAAKELLEPECLSLLNSVSTLKGELSKNELISKNTNTYKSLNSNVGKSSYKMRLVCPALSVVFPNGVAFRANRLTTADLTSSSDSSNDPISLLATLAKAYSKKQALDSARPLLLSKLMISSKELPKYISLKAYISAQQNSLARIPDTYEQIKLSTSLRIGSWKLVEGPSIQKNSWMIFIFAYMALAFCIYFISSVEHRIRVSRLIQYYLTKSRALLVRIDTHS